MLHDIAWRAMQVHGALGVSSNEMPFTGMMLGASVMAWLTAPPRSTRSPSPARCSGTTGPATISGPPATSQAARGGWAKYAEFLELEVGNL